MKLYRPRTWPREQATAVDGENRCTWTLYAERSLLEDRAFLVLEMDQASGAVVAVRGSAPLFFGTSRLAEDHYLAEAIAVPDVDKSQPLEIGLQTRGEIPHYVEEQEEYTYYVSETYTYYVTETYKEFDHYETETYYVTESVPIYNVYRQYFPGSGPTPDKVNPNDPYSTPAYPILVSQQREGWDQVSDSYKNNSYYRIVQVGSKSKKVPKTRQVAVYKTKTRQVPKTGTRSVPKTGTRTVMKNHPFTADWAGTITIPAPGAVDPRMHNEIFSGGKEPVMLYVGGTDGTPMRCVGTQASWLTRATGVDPRDLLYQVADVWIGGPYGTPLKLSSKSTALPYLSADIYTV